MNYTVRKTVNLNGQDVMLTPAEVDYLHRTVVLNEINEIEVFSMF